MNNNNFTHGETIIWDSHCGYEIGIFMGESPAYDRYEIELKTGKYKGISSVSKIEVFKYSKEAINIFTEKYGYEKTYLEIN